MSGPSVGTIALMDSTVDLPFVAITATRGCCRTLFKLGGEAIDRTSLVGHALSNASQLNTPDLSCRRTLAQQVPLHYYVNTKKKKKDKKRSLLVNAALVEREACSFVMFDLQLYHR